MAASLVKRREIGGEQSDLPPHVSGIERARRPAGIAGKNLGMTCTGKNDSGKASWGNWGAPDEYAYGMSYSKHFPPTGSVHDSTWVQEVSWKGRMDREGVISLNKEVSSVDGTDQARIDKMKKFLTHNGASRDSVRNQIEEFGSPVLRTEKEHTRKGYRRTDCGGFYAPALKGKTFKTVPIGHRPRSSTSWAGGVDGPMADMLVSLHQQGYGSGARSTTPASGGGPPSSRGVQKPQPRHARNGTPCSRRVQDSRWAPHTQMGGAPGDLTDRLDHGHQDHSEGAYSRSLCTYCTHILTVCVRCLLCYCSHCSHCAITLSLLPAIPLSGLTVLDFHFCNCLNVVCDTGSEPQFSPRSESQYSQYSRDSGYKSQYSGQSGLSGASRRSGMTNMSGFTGATGMTGRTGMSGAAGTSKSIQAPMPIMSPGVRSMHGIQTPLTRRSTNSHSSWNGYFTDR